MPKFYIQEHKKFKRLKKAQGNVEEFSNKVNDFDRSGKVGCTVEDSEKQKRSLFGDGEGNQVTLFKKKLC